MNWTVDQELAAHTARMEELAQRQREVFAVEYELCQIKTAEGYAAEQCALEPDEQVTNYEHRRGQ